MRYYIIFGITFVIAILLIFYPRKYIHIYKNSIKIDYSSITSTEDSFWNYDISNSNLILEKHKDKVWTFKINKDGKVNIIFYYDKNDTDYKYKIEYRFEVKGNKIYWLYGNGEGMFDFPNPI